ncbi:hypothetical protein PENSPDRAFT_747167 [Peniophora sp. CONT]|nr:hypothetical protein PENSPDRAFT_747167 [Peniophora sp. CONT]
MLSWLKPSQKNAKDAEQTATRDLDASAAVAPASNITSDSTGSNGIASVPKAATLAVSKSEPAQTEPPVPDKPAVTAAIPSAWEPKRRALTSAQSHPHDAVVAELRGQHPDHDTSARMDQAISAPLQSADTLPTAPSEAPGTVMPELDRLFDPHSGATLGIFTPPQMANGQAREELWAHLARIRALQAEIAGLHVAMEGIGLNEKAMHMRVRGTRTRTRSGNVGERLDLGGSEGEFDAEGREEADKEEARLREERDREFETAENRFDGRKEGIDKIMSKLGELAQALATFHALETPVVDFGASRSNTYSDSASPTSERSFTSVPPGARHHGRTPLRLD